MENVMNNKLDARKAGTGGGSGFQPSAAGSQPDSAAPGSLGQVIRLMPRRLMPRLAACALLLAIGAVASVAAAQGQGDQSGKTQSAKNQAGTGQQAPEPVMTVPGKQTLSGESVPDTRHLAWDEMNFYLTSTNPLKREMALGPLAVLPDDPKALALVTKMLAEDKEEDVRVQAAAVLGEGKVKQGIPALRAALDDPKGAVAFAAAKSLWEMDDSSGMPLFRGILLGQRKGGDTMMGGQMQEAKRTMHDPKALAIATANGVTGIFLGPAVLGLKFLEQGVMSDSAALLRVYSARMVGKDKSDAADKALYDGLKDANGLVRAEVCRAFALRDETAALIPMRDAMLDKAPVVRVMASAAVIRLTEGALPDGALKRPPPAATAPATPASAPKPR
jgi:hypothetical protein